MPILDCSSIEEVELTEEEKKTVCDDYSPDCCGTCPCNTMLATLTDDLDGADSDLLFTSLFGV